MHTTSEMLTDISIVIPCYNEVDNIHRLKEELSPVVEDLASYHWVEVIFVDDGSQDGRWDALIEAFGETRIDSLSFRFEKHVTNQGLGAAVRTGFRHCTGSVIMTTDSDGTYRFDTIPALLSCLTPDMDIVTASPYHPEGGVEGVPAYRLLLSRGSSFLYRVLVNPRMFTYTCLYQSLPPVGYSKSGSKFYRLLNQHGNPRQGVTTGLPSCGSTQQCCMLGSMAYRKPK